mgnify:CR=1 FL=1|tara:strand:- start:1690 stop:2124 length:435 start_codon:yes stop_codon:yes gene_type:complete
MNEVSIFYDHPTPPIIENNLKSLCREVLISEGFEKYSLSIIFVDDEKLKKMKKKYFNQDLYTDVIAFNLSDDKSKLDGEIYISFDAIKINSELYKTNINNELQRIVVHGTLHLMGYEDNTKDKKEEMTKTENFFLLNFQQFNLV